ncbi:hypothetical protein POL68_25230 [Stigmatella sp. ncwal1]|uniref:Tetratricopeptide repeat protein n=1 Tax=Stigmatella ashevillensis TaxID=2995309 RepID=A0ABT5DHH9_9BACT|nr:hypothetical protein [Stigmatella ashevillena]MDC0711797.1 hypothetical protein [Stigmatella ashevillena]
MRPFLSCVRLMLALGLGVLSALPGEVLAQDDFQRYLTAAERLYESGENERALVQLERARELARGLSQDVAVALREGIFLADMGKRDQAQAVFREGLLLDPEAQLPLQVSPKLGRDFEEVRTRVRKELGLGERPSPAPSSKAATAPPATSTAPPSVKPQEEPPVAVAKTDRPEQPDLKAPILPEVPAYTPSAASQAPSSVPVVPLVLAGVGVVAASVGAVVGLQSRSSVAEVRDTFSRENLPASSELPGVVQQMDDARSQARLANVMLGTAAVAAAGAIVSYLLSPGGSESASKEAR